MASPLGELLPLAVVVAISPTTLTVVILMLLSGRRTVVSVVFAIGYLVGILFDVLVLLALGGVANLGTGGLSTGVAAWLQLVVGLLLTLFAVDQWSKRPKSGETTKVPKWMASMQTFSVTKAAVVSFGLSALRPKNVLMFAAASVAISAAQTSIADDVISIAIFTIISASTMLALIIGSLLDAERMRPRLDRLNTWLQANTTVMMSVLLFLIGVYEIGRGLAGLF